MLEVARDRAEDRLKIEQTQRDSVEKLRQRNKELEEQLRALCESQVSQLLVPTNITTDQINPNLLRQLTPNLLNTVEPPNKGHIGTRSFVLYREVSFIRRLKCTGTIGIGTSRFGEVSFIGGSTVICFSPQVLRERERAEQQQRKATEPSPDPASDHHDNP